MHICPYCRNPFRYPYNIVVNTSLRKLSLYKNGKLIKSYSIAVGKPSTPTPKGTFTIVNKALNPGGPFGARWMGLNAAGGDYGIHGTNNPASIGRAVSNGCIRLQNRDVIEIYNLILIGTVVKIN
ncbi:MAG TPA: hypothetical protein DD426_06735 [Clostridiaceae bacterium]|nr:hypothetical protein [Clostridiaceae bacterium]